MRNSCFKFIALYSGTNVPLHTVLTENNNLFYQNNKDEKINILFALHALFHH